MYLGFNREKITHLLDWFKAIYLQTKPEYLEKFSDKMDSQNLND